MRFEITLPVTTPDGEMEEREVSARHERIFRDDLVPLAERNPGQPLLFLERGATDNIQAPRYPSGGGHDWAFRTFEFSDAHGNGRDEGRETLANMYQALLNGMDKCPGAVNGVFWWGNWIASDETWDAFPAKQRGYPIRRKLSEEVVRAAYESSAHQTAAIAAGEKVNTIQRIRETRR